MSMSMPVVVAGMMLGAVMVLVVVMMLRHRASFHERPARFGLA
jgi:hypothetical protein